MLEINYLILSLILSCLLSCLLFYLIQQEILISNYSVKYIWNKDTHLPLFYTMVLLCNFGCRLMELTKNVAIFGTITNTIFKQSLQ